MPGLTKKSTINFNKSNILNPISPWWYTPNEIGYSRLVAKQMPLAGRMRQFAVCFSVKFPDNLCLGLRGSDCVYCHRKEKIYIISHKYIWHNKWAILVGPPLFPPKRVLQMDWIRGKCQRQIAVQLRLGESL